MKTERALWLILFIAAFTSSMDAQENDTPRQTVNLPRGATANLPFSDAVLVGNTLYMSGWIGFTPGTTKVPDDPKEEAKFLLDRIPGTLERSRDDDGQSRVGDCVLSRSIPLCYVQ